MAIEKRSQAERLAIVESLLVGIKSEVYEGKAEWIEFGQNKDGTHSIMCSRCGCKLKSKGHARSIYTREHFAYCPMCGTKMQVYTNTTEYIVGVQSKGE